MKVKIKRIDAGAIMPTYGTDGAACFDLYAKRGNNRTFLFTDQTHEVGTGLAFEIPQGFAMLIFSRSGMGFKDAVRLSNCTGVIDSDYRGEVRVKLIRDVYEHFGPVFIDDGTRVAQALILPIERIEFEFADELSNTARNTDGFGSTGA